MNRIDHNLSQLMNLALTADNNKEKNNSTVICNSEIIPKKIQNSSMYGELSHPPIINNKLEIIKRNIPTDMSPAGRELFTCLQDCELSYQLSNKNRKGFLHRKARTTIYSTVRKQLCDIANLPDSALDLFFKKFTNGYLKVKTLKEELEDKKTLENQSKKIAIDTYIDYIKNLT